MKKTLAALLTAALLVSGATFAQADGVDLTSTANYASEAPLIDGKIDDVWATTEKQIIDYASSAGVQITGAYTQVLWDEDGLYILAVVEDDTFTEKDAEAVNSVNFWVSEKNTRMMGWNNDPGDWYFTVASDGTVPSYPGMEKVFEAAESALSATSKGYTIELYVPYLSDIAPAAGVKIGYNATVNDDVDNDHVRDGYTYWSCSSENSSYWENTLGIGTVELIGAPAVEETEAEIVEDPAIVETAPQTSDFGVVAAMTAIVSAAGYMLRQKR